MYTAVIILISIFHISIAAAHFFISSEKWARIAGHISLFAGALGVLGAAVSVAEFYIRISSSDYSSDLKEWCYEVFSGYLKDVLPAFGIIFALLIISSLLQPKMLLLRSALGMLSSVFVLIFSKIAINLFENSQVTVKWEIIFFSISLSLAFLLCRVSDFRRFSNSVPDKDSRKNKKVRVIKK